MKIVSQTREQARRVYEHSTGELWTLIVAWTPSERGTYLQAMPRRPRFFSSQFPDSSMGGHRWVSRV